MPGNKQLEREATIHAPVQLVYDLFMDNRELPNWAPVVDAVVRQEGGDETGVGCTRTCAVTMNGRNGTVVERCIEAVRDSRASYVVVDDSLGFSKLLSGYGFTVHFVRIGDDQTSVRIETFYTPATVVAAVLNRLVMRRKLSAVVDGLLEGLRRLAEHRHATTA